MSFDERGGSDARLDSVTSIAADGEEYRKDDDEEADAVLTPVPLSIRAADSCSVVKAFIGSNYLGVPYSFHLCGIALAVPLFWAIAFFSRQGCRLLIDCKIELDRRDKDQCDNATYGRSSGSSSDGGGCGSAYALADDGVGSGSVDESAGRLRRTSHGHAANHTTSTSSPSQPLLSASSSFISAASSSSLQTSSPRATVTAIDHASSSDSSESDHAGGGYAIVGERLFGARMAHLVRACLVLTQFGFCCGYLVFLSNTLGDLHWLPGAGTGTGWDHSSRRVLLFAAPLAAFALLRDLSALAPFNAFANAALLCGCAAVVFCEFDQIQRTGHTAPVRWAAPTGIPVFFGIMVGALEGIGLVMPLRESISAPGRSGAPRFARFLDLAIVSVTAVLTFVGILGYLCYGDSVPDIIIAALPKDASALVVLRVCLIAGIFFTFPMQVFPITEVLDSYLMGGGGGVGGRTRPSSASLLASAGSGGDIGSDSAAARASASLSVSTSPTLAPPSDRHFDDSCDRNSIASNTSVSEERAVSSAARVLLARAAIRVATVAAIAGVAVAVPQFHLISSFTGCVGGVMLSFVLPACFHQRCFAPAPGSWAHAQNVGLAVVGVAGGLAGVYFNIESLL